MSINQLVLEVAGLSTAAANLQLSLYAQLQVTGPSLSLGTAIGGEWLPNGKCPAEFPRLA